MTRHEAARYVYARLSDLPGIADCHTLAFKGRFMTRMGHHWLCGLYRYFIRHRDSVCVVAIDENGKVLGFAVGGEPGIRGQFLRYAMVRYLHLILWKFLADSVVRPILLKELASKLLKRKRTATVQENAGRQREYTLCGNLLSICVRPECMGTGIADKLVETFRLKCIARGYKRLTLSVVIENARAIAFYKKHNWREIGKSGESAKFILDLYRPSVVTSADSDSSAARTAIH